MEGFFERDKLQSDEIKKGKILSCVSCGLRKHAITPQMKPYGKFKKKVMIIGSIIEKVDDKKGKPFKSENGKALRTALTLLNFNLYKDCISLNSCNCKTSKPTSYQIDCCRKYVLKTIKKYKPKVIILLGDSAIESVIGAVWKKDLGDMKKWHGYVIPDQHYKTYVCPVFDANFVENQKDNTVHKMIWLADLKRALSYINKPFNVQPNFNDYVTLCHTDRQYKQALAKISKSSIFTLDYETTGLRPYMKGHKIICTGVAISPTEAYVWENTLKRDKLFKPILRSKIKKIAHNSQFEDLWTSVLMKTNIKNWWWCTMNNAHIIDNRPLITGLKFQTYVNFGIPNYGEDVSPYLKSDNPKKNQGKNTINKLELYIKRYSIKKVLEYCGLDNIFTFMLYEKQRKLLK